jgi:hypothetical protein
MGVMKVPLPLRPTAFACGSAMDEKAQMIPAAVVELPLKYQL